MTAVLLVPLLPFVVFGEVWEEGEIRRWLEGASSPSVVAALVAGVLATDIFLPIPSSFVSTLGGAALGVWAGTAASWLGLTVGAILGYALARWLGRPLAVRFSSLDELARMERLGQKFGPLILVLARGAPVMAEASVLLLGAARLSWWRFLLPVAAANLGIALAYSAFGDLANRYALLPIVLAVSIALPVVAALLVNRFLPKGPIDADEA
jgi:uncharacterized membrane protein YdjX (TVP38/TMEM64 family)